MTHVITVDGHPKSEGDRVFSVYTGTYGVIRNIREDGWFDFVQDDGQIEYLNGVRISHWVPKVRS